MRRSIMVLLVALVAVGAASCSSWWAKPANNTATVKRGSIEAIVSATGKVGSEQEAKLGFRVSGRIDKVLVKAGDTVEEGQVLAVLDSAALENAVLQAQANLDLAGLKLAQALAVVSVEEIRVAEAGLDSAKARLDELKSRPTSQELIAAKAAMDKAAVAVQDAQNSYDKVSWKEGSPEYMAASRSLQYATIDLEAAKARHEQLAKGPSTEELRIAEAQVTVAQAQLDLKRRGASAEEIAILRKQVDVASLSLQQAKNQQTDVFLSSPLAATVLIVQVNPGETVSPQQWAISVGDTRSLEIKANVDEVDVGKIAEGLEVTISFDAFPGQKVAGTIDRISPASVVQQGSTVYQTVVKFSAPDLPVRPGMAANLDVIAKRKDGVLLVPNRAVQTVGRKKWVETVEDGKRVRVEVETGLYNEGETEVVGGLQEGQTVVVW